MLGYLSKLWSGGARARSGAAMERSKTPPFHQAGRRAGAVVDKALPDERAGDMALFSERLQIERKQFFFDMKENASGRFLRITEDVAGRRDTIIVPATGLSGFRDAIDHALAADVVRD